VLVAEVDGTFLGFVAFTGDGSTRTGQIRLSAVQLDHAGRGLGTRPDRERPDA
jgi:hypothetical protein